MKRIAACFLCLACFTIESLGQALAPCGTDRRQKFPDECNTVDKALEILRKGAMARTQTESTDIAGIRVTIYSPLLASAEGIKDVRVAAFNTKEKRVLVFQHLYDSGGVDLEQRTGEVFARFLRDVLILDLTGHAFGEQPSFRVIGHSDLERTTAGKSYDTLGECQKANLSKDANDCLALARAQDFTKQIRGKTATTGPKIRTTYSSDFFLREVNDETGGHLLAAIGAVGTVKELKRRWGLDEQYIAREVRSREDIQRDIALNLQEMRRRFAPFRSVVVIVD